MTPSRRHVIAWGGGAIATLLLPLPARAATDADIVDVTMAGRPDGSAVWFEPSGLLIQPGQSVRWTNSDPGNSHTSTAYHPQLGRSRRIPEAAAPWDSDYLLPDQSFEVAFTVPGVYDYFCQPHEHAGMVGRIVVGTPPAGDWWNGEALVVDPDLPDIALNAFPPIEAIITEGSVSR